MTDNGHRIWQVDAARGVLVLLMVLYHLLWDLYFLRLFSVDVTTGGWHRFSQAIGSGFLMVAGVSLVLSAMRNPVQASQWSRSKRGIKLLAWSAIITVVTWLFLGEQLIAFGILHLIATAYLLSPFLWRAGFVTPLIGVVFFLLGPVVDRISVSTYLLLPLGLAPKGYQFVDYYPVIPWLGYFMVGVGIGRLLFQGQQFGSGPSSSVPREIKWIAFVGRHSLLIYLLHQPVLLAGIWGLGYELEAVSELTLFLPPIMSSRSR